MASSTPDFKFPRHREVWRLLTSLDGGFLARARCYFGGGTRIVLALREYRQSADIDFLCADMAGYRMLRSTITDRSLGAILKRPVELVRDVRADQYGIRTFMETEGGPIKFEIIREARIHLHPDSPASLPVPSLNAESCFAEKFLANTDRHGDRSTFSRDIIDLAFMADHWGPEPGAAGFKRAEEAYGAAVNKALAEAIHRLQGDGEHRTKCLRELAVSNSGTLRKGLRSLSRWRQERYLRRNPRNHAAHRS